MLEKSRLWYRNKLLFIVICICLGVLWISNKLLDQDSSRGIVNRLVAENLFNIQSVHTGYSNVKDPAFKVEDRPTVTTRHLFLNDFPMDSVSVDHL